MNVNKVILIGRLTRDPEMRTTPSGQNVTNIGLATSRVYNDKNGQRQETTEFHNLVLWGRTAEIAAQYLIKGQEAYFEGRLTHRKYTGKDGVERSATDIVVENMQLGSKPQGASAPRQQAPQTRPQNTAAQQPAAEEKIPTINLDDEGGDIRIEDVPF